MRRSSVEISFVAVEADEVAVVMALAAQRGVQAQEVDSRGIEPFALVTLALAGSYGAIHAVIEVLEQYRGGQVIDSRPGAERAFYRSRDLTYGLVLLIGTDGTKQLGLKNARSGSVKLQSLLPQLPSSRTGMKTSQLVEALHEMLPGEVGEAQ